MSDPPMTVRLCLRETLKVLIALFWVFMAFLLVKRVHLVPEVTPIPAAPLEDSESWMSVFFKGQKVGYSVQALSRVEQGYIVDQKTYLRLKFLGQVQEVRTVTSVVLGRAMGLKSFHFLMAAGPIRYQMSGRLRGLTLELRSMTAGHESKTELTLKEVPRLATGLMAFLAHKGLSVGERFRVPLFDPATLSSRPVRVVVEDTEKIVAAGQTYETYRVRMDYFDTQSYAWIDDKGRTIKEEGLLGLSLVRTTPEEATKGVAGRAELTDVVAATSAPSSRVLEDPRQARFLRARLKNVDLTGFELAGHRQGLDGEVVEVSRERIDVRDEVPLPLSDPELRPFLQPTQFIQSRHPEIIRRARAITGGEKSPLEITGRVVDWTFEHLEKRPTMSVPSAVDILETRVGDCNEHAVLAAALLRAAGVPTRVCVGVLYFEGRFYYHAWLEVFWGRWLAVDPLLGQVPADATHIRFLRGGLSRQAEMVRLMGRLEIEILEVR